MKRIKLSKHSWLQLERQSYPRFIISLQIGRIELGLIYNLIYDWRA